MGGNAHRLARVRGLFTKLPLCAWDGALWWACLAKPACNPPDPGPTGEVGGAWHVVAPPWGTYRLQLPQEGMLQCPLAGRLGHVQVQAVPPAHGVQAEHEGHVVLEQAGICRAAAAGWGCRVRARGPPGSLGLIPAQPRPLRPLTCVVQVILQPALSSLVVKLATSRGKEQKVVPGGGGQGGISFNRWAARSPTRRWAHGQDPDQPSGQGPPSVLLTSEQVIFWEVLWALLGVSSLPGPHTLSARGTQS